MYSNKESKTITLIKEAKIPESYEGKLIKLKSENLDDIKLVITNLKIEKIIMFDKDAKIAEKLSEVDFNVVLV